MAVPWLRLIDTALGMADFVRMRRLRGAADLESEGERALAPSAIGGLETRLAGVVVAALKEAFDRDSRRLELEREQLEAERRRAERALQLELLRQSGDREIGRLRLVAGIAVASWIGTLFFSSRLIGGPAAARVLLGGGWVLLLGAVAASFSAQSAIARAIERLGPSAGQDPLGSGAGLPQGGAGALAPWLVVAGLALVGVAVLV